MSELNFNIPFEPFASTRYNFQNLVGKHFGRLLVVSIYSRGSCNAVLWLCRCKCKTWTIVRAGNLRSDIATSCGCVARQQAANRVKTHGEASITTKTPEYAAYIRAKSRYNNPKGKEYDNYGGRGIEFQFDSFETFLAEIGRRPASKHSLNRINNDGHYATGNVEWATQSAQCRNQRRNRVLTAFGESKLAIEWSEVFGIARATIIARIDRYKWNIEDAVSKPIQQHS